MQPTWVVVVKQVRGHTVFFYIHSYPELKQHQTTATSLLRVFFSEWECIFHHFVRHQLKNKFVKKTYELN